MTADYVAGVVATIVTFCLGVAVSLAIAWLRDREAEKRLRIEVYYQDRRRAAEKLHTLVNKRYKSYDEFKERLLDFLGGFEAQFLPDEFREKLGSHISKMDGVIQRYFPKEEPSEEETNYWAEYYAKMWEELPPEEKAEVRIDQNFDSMKKSIIRDVENLVRQLAE